MEEGTPPAQQADLQDVELGESEEAPGSEITPLAPADVELGRQQQQPPPPPPPPRASAAGSAAGGDVRPLRDCDSVEKTEADAVAEREKWANKTAAAVGVDDDQDQHDQAQLLSAFLACDLDGSGEIGPAELRAILLAIGADVDLETTRQLVADAERQTVERNRQQAQLELTVHVGGLSTFKLVGEGGADSERAKAAYEKELTDLMAQFGAINSVHVRVREREDVVESVAIQKVSWGLVTYHKVSEVAAAIKGQAQIKKQKPEWTDLVVRPIDAKQVEASKGAMRQLKELQWTDPKRHFERTYGLAIQASTHAEAPAGRLRQAVRRVAAVGGAAEAAGGDDELEGQLDFGEFEQLMSGPLLEKLLIGSGSGADTQGDEQSQKDLALLNELLLSECAEALREAGLLGRLKDVTWAELEEAGIERESAHQLLKFASLSVGQRGRERVGRIRALRQAFDTADVDDDDAVDRDELETVIVALNPRPISPAEVDLLWNMLKPDDDGKQYLLRFLSWMDFLQGIARVRKDATARKIMGLNRPNQWSLISLLVDVKFPPEEEKALMDKLSYFESHGIKHLQTKQSKELSKEDYTKVLEKVSNGTLRYIDPERAAAILNHQRRVGWLAFLIGLVMNLIYGAWDHWTKSTLDSDGMVDLFYTCNDLGPLEVPADDVVIEECPTSDTGTIVAYWSRTAPVLGVCVAIEIFLLGLVAVKGACAIAAEHGYRLVPLNQERAFVADALIRTCFEMGNPKSPFVGVDPATQPSLRRKLGIALMGAFLAGKIVLLNQLLKLVVKAALPISYETWALSYTAVVASCFWDILVCRMIMEQVTLIATGIAVSPEVFNEIVAKTYLRKSAEIVCVRAIAVAMGTQGQMMPTMELLLRHAIQYFGLAGSEQIIAPPTPLDSVPCFLSDLGKLEPEEQEAVMCVLLLTQILDGCLEKPELVLWSRVYKQIGREQGPDELALRGCACALRTQQDVDAQLLRMALDEDDSNDRPSQLGLGDSLWFKARKLLLK